MGANSSTDAAEFRAKYGHHYSTGKPSIPEGIPKVTDITHNSIILSWLSPVNSGRILAYQVECCNLKDRKWRIVTSTCQGSTPTVKNNNNNKFHKLILDSFFLPFVVFNSINMSSQVQNLQKQLLQLRQEANVERIPVSQAIEEILKYTARHEQTDGLVFGVNPSENPFKDAKGCLIL